MIKSRKGLLSCRPPLVAHIQAAASVAFILWLDGEMGAGSFAP
jgi:hypothetical protein